MPGARAHVAVAPVRCHTLRVSLTNRDIAELLSRESAHTDGHRRRALRRAARAAFLWPEEAAALVEADRSLTELRAVGPYLADVIRRWLDADVAPPAPPELRHDFLTRADARRIIAAAPGWRERLAGDLQVHTTWSDGGASVGEMADAARALGHRWVAITDHSKGLRIAGGIDETALAAQADEIAALPPTTAADGSPFRILHGMELNLSPGGDGDMESAALARLDVVLGAFHSALRRTDDQTARYVAGVRNRDIQILAHPRGRIYDFRLGLRADWARVFAVAAECDKAVEIDAYPDRQDLNRELLALARREGTRISLGSDAHGAGQLAAIELGLAAALDAGIPADRIVNFLSVPAFAGWVAGVRGR